MQRLRVRDMRSLLYALASGAAIVLGQIGASNLKDHRIAATGVLIFAFGIVGLLYWLLPRTKL
jgi:hypothetical protein